MKISPEEGIGNHEVSAFTILSKKQAENPHLNIEYRWGLNAVNASDREIWSKK